MAVADGQMGIHFREKHIVLGLDPGRDKTGFAFVDREGELILSGIFPSSEGDKFFRGVKSNFYGDAATSLNSNGYAATPTNPNDSATFLNSNDVAVTPQTTNYAATSLNSNDVAVTPQTTNYAATSLNSNGYAATPQTTNDSATSLNSNDDITNSNGDALSKWIIEKVSALPEDLLQAIAFIAIGNGTHSKHFTEKVRAVFSCEVLTVDERNTTLEARSLYWKLHAPNFWTRLIPEGLRVPARVLDDLAAWAIALRGLKKYRDINQNRL